MGVFQLLKHCSAPELAWVFIDASAISADSKGDHAEVPKILPLPPAWPVLKERLRESFLVHLFVSIYAFIVASCQPQLWLHVCGGIFRSTFPAMHNILSLFVKWHWPLVMFMTNCSFFLSDNFFPGGFFDHLAHRVCLLPLLPSPCISASHSSLSKLDPNSNGFRSQVGNKQVKLAECLHIKPMTRGSHD